MSKKRPTETGVTRGGPHHAPRLRPDQCMLCRQVRHRASECPKGKATALSPCKRALVPMLWVLPCSLFLVMVKLSKKSNKIKTKVTSETLLRSQSRVWRGSAILDGGATKTVAGFKSFQPVADQYEGTTIETTDFGFAFAGGETEAATTNICISHAECPQGISVNVVSNESTPFLIGLDVLREYGLVIDYHYNRVKSHVLTR